MLGFGRDWAMLGGRGGDVKGGVGDFVDFLPQHQNPV